MKTILLFDPRFPDRRPTRLRLADELASAAVRSGIAAAANPNEAGALSAGGPLDPASLTPVVVQHGNNGDQLARILLPFSVVIVGAGLGVLASIGAPVTGGVAPMPTISFAVPNATIAEGNNGTQTVTSTINVVRNGLANALTVNLAYGGTAATGSDYVAGPSSVTIASGAFSVSFELTINGDTTVEQDETIIITATLAGYSVTATKTITVTNDDAAPFQAATLTRTTASGTNPPEFDQTTGDAQIDVHSFRLVQTRGVGGAEIARETKPFNSDFALSYEDADDIDWTTLGVVSGGGPWAAYIDTLVTSTSAVVATSNTITDNLANVANPTTWSATDHGAGIAFDQNDGRRTASNPVNQGGNWYGARGDVSYNTGNWRIEFTVVAAPVADSIQLGLVASNTGLSREQYGGFGSGGIQQNAFVTYYKDGGFVYNGDGAGGPASVGQVGGIYAFDFYADGVTGASPVAANTGKLTVIRAGNVIFTGTKSLSARTMALFPYATVTIGGQIKITTTTTPPSGVKHWGNP